MTRVLSRFLSGAAEVDFPPSPHSSDEGLAVVQAYILIQTEVGKAAAVATTIAEIDGVTQAEDVTGPYDVIVRAEANNVDELGKLVVAKVQAVAGITRTLTCPVVHL
jgi:DNA-binding Lrp family transcriptional regulator